MVFWQMLESRGTMPGMPEQILQSAHHAFRGLLDAFRKERNLQLFSVCYLLLLLYASLFPLTQSDWLTLSFAGGIFVITELLNTALERLADAFDDHLKAEHRKESFAAIRMAKDIAASASLVSLLLVVAVSLVIFVSHLL